MDFLLLNPFLKIKKKIAMFYGDLMINYSEINIYNLQQIAAHQTKAVNRQRKSL